jgi:AAA family ATP:ADP antiporter
VKNPSAAQGIKPRGILDRFLSLFADVQGGEGATAFLLMVDVFLLLGCYYILKPVREAFILSGSGAEVKAYLAGVMVFALLFIIPAYGRLASRVSRTSLLTWVTLFFVLCLLVFYFLAQAQVRYLDSAFFVWMGIFNVMIIAQFWALANDIYTAEEGKRLFAVVAVGSTLGAIVGATVFEKLVDPKKSDPGSVNRMLLVAAAILVVCAILTRFISRREKVAQATPEDRDETVEKPIDPKGGFRLVFDQRYLLLIAFMIMVVNLVNTTGEYLLGRTLEDTAHQLVASGQTSGLAPDEFQKQFIGNYYAGFFKWVNWLTALIQMFVVSRFFKWFGVRAALFVLPAIALGGYGMLAFAQMTAILPFIRAVKIAENSSDYSIQNTARQALFLPTSREAKYKAKQVIDSLFWRAGDVISALLVFLGTQVALGSRQFAAMNAGLVVIWLLLAVGIAREHRRITETSAPRAEPVL